MGKVRTLLLTGAGVVAGYASGRVLVRGRDRGVGPGLDGGDGELLGSPRGRPRMITGPRASRIYAERFDAGEGSRGTLVLTHGWCVTEAIWHYQKLAFDGGPFGLTTWDLPGHGHSTPVARDHLTIDVAVDALARVVDSVEDERLILVGHSLGGILTMGYLLRHSETARRRVRGAVLAATPLVHFAHGAAGRWPGASLKARVLGRAAQLAIENGQVDRFLAREAGSGDPSAATFRVIEAGFGASPSPRQVRFVRDMVATVPPSARADTFRAMTGFDLRPRLPEVEVPVLIVIGGRDRLVNADESRDLARLLPRSSVEEIPEAGHALCLERHEAFNELLLRFARARLRARKSSSAPIRSRRSGSVSRSERGAR